MRDVPRTYRVLCSHLGSAWAVRIPELDREAAAARLSQVEAVARALVSTYAGDDTGAADFTVELMPDALSAALAAAAAARKGTVRFPAQELLTRRRLARELYVEGLEVADIGAALGVSSGQVQLLISEGVEPVGLPVTAEAPLPVASVLAPRRRARARVGLSTPLHRRSPINAPRLHGENLDPPADHRYRHEALLYRGDDAFLEGTVPFLQQGLDLGHAVMVAVPEPRLTQVREALGSRVKDVTLVDIRRLGANPARIIPAWQQLIDEQHPHGRPVRGVSEPLWPGRRPVERTECHLHETMLNLAFDRGDTTVAALRLRRRPPQRRRDPVRRRSTTRSWSRAPVPPAAAAPSATGAAPRPSTPPCPHPRSRQRRCRSAAATSATCANR